MNRSLSLESWKPDSDDPCGDRTYDAVDFADVRRELASITEERVVDLRDNWGLEIRYGIGSGISLEAGTSRLRLKRGVQAQEEVDRRFKWFYSGDFEELLRCHWDSILGYSPITLETISALAEQAGGSTCDPR